MRPRRGILLAALTAVVATLSAVVTVAPAASAVSSAVDYCPYIPVLSTGIPPWGFHTGSPISNETGSYARGHGDISLSSDTVSGVICKVDRVRQRQRPHDRDDGRCPASAITPTTPRCGAIRATSCTSPCA